MSAKRKPDNEKLMLFGKQREIARISEMIRGNRIPHAILLSGDSGIGKQHLARWLAALFLCENPVCENGVYRPCLNCRNCRNIEKNEHADVIVAGDEKYTADNLRDLLHSTSYLPNDGDLRIIILKNCDTMTDIQQNILLKSIEEPSACNRFILLCCDTSKLLTTVFSRVVNIPMSELTYREAVECLAAYGTEQETAAERVALYGTNIGNINEILSDKNSELNFSTARNILTALADKNEYNSAVEFSGISDKDTLFSILDMLYKKIGYAAAHRAERGRDKICDMLNSGLTVRELATASDKLSDMLALKNTNVNLKLMLSCCNAQLFEIFN